MQGNRENHIVFIENPIFIRNENRENADFNFPEINDANKVYEFHNYDPYQYTHQLLGYTNLPDGGKYPDENLINFENESWYSGIFNNPTVPSGNSDWTKYEGVKFKIEDPKMKIGVPVLVGGGVGGRIYFDDMVIKEYDQSGNFVRDVLSKNLNSSYQWGYWSSNNTGTFGESSSTGVNDNTSLYIEANTLDCNLSNYSMAFIPKQGFYYQISGYMKGENVVANSFCSVRIDFLTTESPVLSRNKQFLEYQITKYSNWGNAKNVPVYLGEFGAGRFCFDNNKGGLQYVTDFIDITKSNNVSFTYHNYHGDDFSLYFNSNALPNPGDVNQPLIDLFTQKLK